MIAWLKTVFSGSLFFVFLLLLLRDTINSHDYFAELLFVILNVLILFFIPAIYISVVLFPLSFIDGKYFKNNNKEKILLKYIPFITSGIALLFLCFFPFTTYEGKLNGQSVIFFLNFYHAAYGGLLFFIHTSKNRELKKQKYVNTNSNQQL